MKKALGIIITIAVLLIVAGVVLIIIGGYHGGGWNVEYTDESFTSQNEVTCLELDVAAGTADVEFYDGDNIEIAYQAHPKYGFTATQSGGKVTLGHSRSGWFSWGTRKAPTATVKIPSKLVLDLDIDIGAGSITVQSGTFKSLKIDVSAGKLTMGNTDCNEAKVHISAGSFSVSGLSCGKINCHVSAGSADFSDVVCDVIDLDVSAGTVDVNVKGNKSDYTILVDKSAGSCNVVSQQGTDANKKIDIDVSAGTVKVNFN